MKTVVKNEKNNEKIKGMYLQNCSYYVLQRIKVCINLMPRKMTFTKWFIIRFI